MRAVESNGINPLLEQRNKATSACHSVPIHHLREPECHDSVYYPLACVLGEAIRMDSEARTQAAMAWSGSRSRD